MKVNLITGNSNKVKEFKILLEPEIKVNHIPLEYPELRSDDPEEIVKVAVKQLAEKLEIPVIAEDSGLFIDAKNGFPGTCTKYVSERIGNKGLLMLMKGVKNRKIFYRSAIGYCNPGKDPVSFRGMEEGTMSEKEKGTNGWGQDPIFIPKGKDKTYGETREKDDVNIFRQKAICQLKEFILKSNQRDPSDNLSLS